MDASVRYIPTDIHPKYGAIGNKPALCFRGTKKAHCVVNDESSVHVVILPLDIHDRSRAVPGSWNHGEYSPQRFREYVLKKLAKPITLQARRLLDSINDAEPIDLEELEAVPDTTPAAGARAVAAGPSIVATIAAEMKLAGSKVRKLLRAAGLRAPYDDEAKIRAALAPKDAPEPAKKEGTPLQQLSQELGKMFTPEKSKKKPSKKGKK